jgi:hypothetical protein
MADRIYTLIYQCNNADALAKTAQLTAALNQLDAQAIRTQSHVKGYATGSSASANAAAKGAERLAAALGQVQIGAAGAGATMQGLAAASAGAVPHVSSLSQNLVGLGGGLVALQAGRVVLDAIATALKDARDYSKQAAEANLAYKDSLRETANLSDKAKPDQALAAQEIDLMMQTGMKSDEARKFSNEFKGSIYAARTKKHLQPAIGTPEQLEADMQMLAARTSTAKQVEGKAMANLVSSIAISGPVRSKEQVGAEIGLSVEAMNEGIGSLSDMTRQVLNARGSLISGGFAQSIPDVAALVSGMTINEPVGRTANRIESMVSGISQATAGKSAAKMAEIGITSDTRDFVEVLQKLKPIVEKAEAPGGGGARAVLADLGITQGRARESIIKSVQELPIYEKLIAKNREVLGDTSKGIKADPAKVSAANQRLVGSLDEFRKADSTGRFADAEMFAANFLRGSRTERLTVQRKSAAAELIAEEKIKTAPAALEGWIKGGFGIEEKLGGKPAEEKMVDKLVAKRLLIRAKKAGLSEKQITQAAPGLAGAAVSGSAFLGDEQFGQQVELLEATMAGGKIGAVTKDVLAQQKGVGLGGRIKAMAGAPSAGVGGPGGGMGGEPSADAEALRIQAQQLDELKGIKDRLGGQGGGGVGAGLGPAPVPGGAVRVGEG